MSVQTATAPTATQVWADVSTATIASHLARHGLRNQFMLVPMRADAPGVTSNLRTGVFDIAAVGQPVVCAGVTVMQGDLIVGDAEGSIEGLYPPTDSVRAAYESWQAENSPQTPPLAAFQTAEGVL